MADDNLRGSSGDDDFVNNTGEDLRGRGGDDTILGLGGDDRIFGDKGNDRVGGGEGEDTVYGGEGDDKVNGGKGGDFLAGGSGDDVLKGGLQDDMDLFFFDQNFGSDTIKEWEIYDFLVFEDGNDPTTVREVGNDVVIRTQDGDTVTILDANRADVEDRIFENYSDVIGNYFLTAPLTM